MIEPCGTPIPIGELEDFLIFFVMYCCQFSRQLRSNWRVKPHMPYVNILNNRISLFTKWNVLWRSRKRQSPYLIASKRSWVCFNSLPTELSVDNPLIKQLSCSHKIFLCMRYLLRCLHNCFRILYCKTKVLKLVENNVITILTVLCLFPAGFFPACRFPDGLLPARSFPS